ncbi:MAG: hypothetical protein LBM67_08335 [Lentimicrobiaceae bacterium]|jgi:hypothetical protein|nr:hypothetical protein [Lentimicrobiaceae bacterium]
METKLKLKDICGNIEYKLKYIDSFGYISVAKTLNTDGFIDKNYSTIPDKTAQIKPILRPLSDLYKEISHNGEKFIPIVRLAESSENKTLKKCNCWKLRIKENPLLEDFKYTAVSETGITFAYRKYGFFCADDEITNFEINQVELFDLLNEWKIDYRGLIEKGLAVSVHDFKEVIYS